MIDIILLIIVLLILLIGFVGLLRMGIAYERRIKKDTVLGKRSPPDYDVEDADERFPRPSGRGWPISNDITTDEDEHDNRN